MFQLTERRTRWISLISAALVTALIMTTFVNVGTAFADEGDDPARDAYGEKIDERLEACFEKLNEWYEIQDGNIGKASNAINRIEEALTKAAELGIDTSAVDALMPGLYTSVDQAEAYHARAGQILSEHAGFNGSGKVKDRELALETCKSGRDALASARDSLLSARDIVREIIEIVKEWRKNYVPTSDTIS
jgi:hypothetical protein